jgi:hypothetical protein
MSYQTSPQIITRTQDHRRIEFVLDYERKQVAVRIGGVNAGTFPNITAAKAALNLVDVQPTKRSR